MRWLIVPAFAGMLLLAWGLVQLSIWPTIFGAALIVLAQLWRLDRLGLIYEEWQRSLRENGDQSCQPDKNGRTR